MLQLHFLDCKSKTEIRWCRRMNLKVLNRLSSEKWTISCYNPWRRRHDKLVEQYTSKTKSKTPVQSSQLHTETSPTHPCLLLSLAWTSSTPFFMDILLTLRVASPNIRESFPWQQLVRAKGEKWQGQQLSQSQKINQDVVRLCMSNISFHIRS